MLLTTDSCVDNFIKVKWAPWQTDTTVKESIKRYRKGRATEREREGRGRELEWTWDANLVLYSFLTVQDDDDVGDDR